MESQYRAVPHEVERGLLKKALLAALQTDRLTNEEKEALARIIRRSFY